MSDKCNQQGTPEVDHGRRRAMTKIAVGVGALTCVTALPEKWTKPIIDSIVLPAHAATSGSLMMEKLDVEYRIGDASTNSVTVKVSGYVNPPATGIPVSITVTPVIG